MSNDNEGVSGTMTPGRPFRRNRKLLAGIVSVLAVSGVVAAVVMFTHQVPFVPALGMTTACADLKADPATVIAGASGFLRMTCAGAAAFSVVVNTLSIPSFALSGGYTGFWVYLHASPPSASCSDGGGATQLMSGGAVAWPSTSGWSYCAAYANAPASGLAAFTVSWST